ncbi:fructose-specific PTS transporter subunit EIIC [Streptococcus uberis]|uniref:PTS fructose transporter subunit IIABC n=1 Tax=Streptococcus uberis TaxID=1349 RepID=UPI001FF151E1|nr:fructose-specific PTS transporter subunit EIIC [Streptococcus uberis]MCK1167283.1 fructose-specific PTS transporter subunit EIIC [Streptococcus uberis]
MDLRQATRHDLIFLNQEFSTKESIFDFVSQKFKEKGIVESKEVFKEALYNRESQGVTGFEHGLAIPHGKSNTVNQAAFAIIRLKDCLPENEYKSLIETNKVKLLFVLAIPEGSNNEHIKLLAELSGKLADKDTVDHFMGADSVDSIMHLLEFGNGDKSMTKDKGLILAVTACAAGVAHTYMAAEALTKVGKEKGYAVKVEKQGAAGVEDLITVDDISNAVGVILAHDVRLKNIERFEGLPVIDTNVGAPIKNAKKLIDDLLLQEGNNITPIASRTEIQEKPKESKGFWADIFESGKNHLMTGVSYMLPFVVAGGMILTIGLLLGGGKVDSGWTKTTVDVGVAIFGLMYPVLGGYIAYSIADKPALVVGMAGGLLSNTVGAGYLGALLAGFLAGAIVKLIKRLPVAEFIKPIVPLVIIPLVGSATIAAIMYGIGGPLQALNKAMENGLASLQGGNLVILGLIIGAMMAVDMGGPINKAAFAFCVGMIGQKIYAPMAACWIGIMTPPVALAIATMIAPKKFTEAEKASRLTAIIGGLTGITEFAIPFAVRDPWRVILSLVIGSGVGGALALGLGVKASIPSGGIFVVWAFENPIGFLIAFVVGILTTALTVVALKKEVL